MSNGVRNRRRLEIRGVDANHSDVSFGEFFSTLVIDDFKLVPNGLFTFELWIQTHPDCITSSNRFEKFREGLDPWNPNTVLLEHVLTIRTSSTEKFLFRLLDEPEEMRKEHDSSRIGICPIGLKLHFKHDARL